MILKNMLLPHFPFVLINVWLPNLCDYKFVMIIHVILCLNEREIQKKRKRKIIGQEDQMLEMTFDSPLGTFNLSFSKMNSPYSPKAKVKEWKKKKKKKKKNRGEMRRKKRKKEKREKLLFVPPYLKSKFYVTLWKFIFEYLSLPQVSISKFHLMWVEK